MATFIASRVKTWSKDFLGGPVVKNSPFSEKMQVPSLVRELRSRVPLGN